MIIDELNASTTCFFDRSYTQLVFAIRSIHIPDRPRNYVYNSMCRVMAK